MQEGSMKHPSFVCAFLLLVTCMLPAQTNPVPFINQPLVPETVPPGSGGFTLTVHGANFAPTATVKWNGLVRQTVVVSDTLLQATIKASDVATARTASVTVVNVDAHNETSNVAYLTVRKSAPVVAMIATPNFSATGVVSDGDFNNEWQTRCGRMQCQRNNPRCRRLLEPGKSQVWVSH